MFGEWDDNEWCQFDNYMVKCLQLFLDKGLLKSEFVNLKTRKLSAETCHEFVEWCGIIGEQPNTKLVTQTRIYKNDLYLDFIDENPDFAPKAKMTISRNRFNKWLVAYSLFQFNCPPSEGRDNVGRWIEFVTPQFYETDGELDL